MFLRTKRVHGHEYLVIVENFRADGRVKQRTLRYLGRRDRVDLADVRRALASMPGFAFLEQEPR